MCDDLEEDKEEEDFQTVPLDDDHKHLYLIPHWITFHDILVIFCIDYLLNNLFFHLNYHELFK